MVLLADLPLTGCSEGFESVSLRSSTRLTLQEGGTNNKKDDKKFISLYASRPTSFDRYSLHDYFHLLKNQGDKTKRSGAKVLIPNFFGVNGTPKYPVTEDYARHTIIVYRPWRTFPKNLQWIAEFNNFINSPACPVSARMPYEREMQRVFDGMQHYEATASKPDHSNNPLTEVDQELLELLGMRDKEFIERDEALLKSMNYGTHHDWGVLPKVSQMSEIVLKTLIRTPGKISWQLKH